MSRRKRSARTVVVEELETLPLMNLFVVLIPMLLLSAVFLEMSVIRMHLPGDDDASESTRERLGLSVAILDEAWVIHGRGVKERVIDRTGPDAATELRATLGGISETFPEDHDVVVRSAERTRYEDIVEVMDASRESGFPNVSLSGGAS
jgi:biopolymer transport protein ExbD